MKICFWGVRGSIPTPLTGSNIETKIRNVLERITPSDVETPEAKERFLMKLPSYLNGTFGGNTSCVELTGKDGTKIILDAGSGIRVYAKNGQKPFDGHFHLFLSHFHWDHIQGLPYFDDAYNKNCTIDIYSFADDCEARLRAQQEFSFFPVPFDKLTHNFNFIKVQEGTEITINEFKVSAINMKHPGGCLAYSFTEGNKKFVYCTDVELTKQDFEKTPLRIKIFQDADCIILDSQYTVEESHKKNNWGHTAFNTAIDFAAYWNIKKVYLFHHEPMYDDKKLESLLNSAQWYVQNIVHSQIEVHLSVEGEESEI